jgi:uncharacterized protein YndB with AHSA1/START domain
MNVDTKMHAVYEVHIKAPRERVWDAITKPEFTKRYFHSCLVQTSLVLGTPFIHLTPDGSGKMVEGTVVECDPPSRLVHSWRSLWAEEVAKDAPSRLGVSYLKV